MLVHKLYTKYAQTGTVSRRTFNLATGLPSATVSATVPMSVLTREQPDTLTDTVPVTDSRIRVSKNLLDAEGFPTPVKDGDYIEFASIKGAIRTPLVRRFRNDVVYVCRVEITNS